MYWIFIFFLFVIVLMVIYTHRAKAEKESHNWLNEENHVDEKPKIKMQELACCHTTFYGSTDPARIEKAYREACERGGRENFFPVLLVLEDNLIINILDQLGIEDGKNGIDMAKVQARRQELMYPTENAKDWLDLRLRELQNGFETESSDFYRTDVLGEYVENGIGNTSFSGIINDETGRTKPAAARPWPWGGRGRAHRGASPRGCHGRTWLPRDSSRSLALPISNSSSSSYIFYS